MGSAEEPYDSDMTHSYRLTQGRLIRYPLSRVEKWTKWSIDIISDILWGFMNRESAAEIVTNFLVAADGAPFTDFKILRSRKALECIVKHLHFELHSEYPDEATEWKFSTIMGKLKKRVDKNMHNSIYDVNTLINEAEELHYDPSLETANKKVVAEYKKIRELIIGLFWDIFEIQLDLEYSQNDEEGRFVDAHKWAINRELTEKGISDTSGELRLGREHMLAGDYWIATGHLKQALASPDSSGWDKEVIARCHHELGDCYVELSKIEDEAWRGGRESYWGEIMNHYKEARSNYDSISNERELLKVHFEIARRSRYISGPLKIETDKLDHLIEYLEFSQKIGNKKHEQFAMKKLTDFYYAAGQGNEENRTTGAFDTSEEWHNSFKSVTEEIEGMSGEHYFGYNYEYIQIIAHQTDAGFLYERGNIEESLLAYQRVDQEYIDYRGNHENVIPDHLWCINQISVLLEEMGRYDESVTTLERGLGLAPIAFSSITPDFATSFWITRILNIAWKMDDSERQVDVLERGIGIAQEESEDWYEIDYRNKLARLKFFQGDYDSAKQNQLRCLEICDAREQTAETNNYQWRRALFWLGEIERMPLGNLAQSKQYFEACLSQTNETEFGLDYYLDVTAEQRKWIEPEPVWILSWTYFRLAFLLMEENPKLSEEFFRNCVRLNNVINNPVPDWMENRGFTDPEGDWDFPPPND